MGGTIDSYYDGIKETSVPNQKTIIPQYIGNLKLQRERVLFTTVCLKDSRQITSEDHKKVAKVIAGSKATRIIITHGTYTMPDTARYIEAHLNSKKNNKKIILTGSFIPLNGFTMSDGGFNIGFALGVMDYIKEGVYVAMNGRLFRASEVIKFASEGVFSSILK